MILATALVLALAGASDDDIDALKAAAKDATASERYCDAHGYFQALFARTDELKHLYNAAEVARAAKDNVAALAAYRAVLQRAAADFPERERVQRGVTELQATLASGELGVACGPPPPLPPSKPHEQPQPKPHADPPAPVEPSGNATLVMAGGIVAGTGAVVALGFGAWAAVLESQLRTRAPDVTRQQKDAALAAGWPVVLGAASGAVVAGAGAALVVVGLE